MSLHQLPVLGFVLRPPVLWVWLGYSLLTWFCLFYLRSDLGFLFSLLILFVCCLPLMRYAFVIIELTAKGHTEVPGFTLEDQADHRSGTLLLLIAIAGGLITSTPELYRPVTTAFILMIAPAITSFVTFKTGLLQSLHPIRVYQFIRNMGGTYVTLRLLTTSVGFVLLFAVDTGFDLMESATGAAMLSLLAIFLLLTMVRATGVLLHLKRDELGIQTDFSEEQAQQEKDQQTLDACRERVLHIESIRKRDGNDAAWKLMTRELKTQKYRDEAFYYEASRELKYPDLAYKLAGGYIGRLSKHHNAMAWELLQGLWQETNGTFRLASGETVLTMAKTADNREQTEIVLTLIESFDDTFPSHPKSRQAYLTGTELALRLEEYDRAKSLFRNVQKRRGLIGRIQYNRCQKLIAQLN